LQLLDATEKPRLRGVLHGYAFVVAIAFGIVLVLIASTARERLAAAVFAAAMTGMFGVSALYHRPNWSTRPRRWLRRLDHAMIYLLIAGTYTPFGLLVLSGAWQVTVLAIVWSGAAVAILLKFVWIDSPKWVAVVLGVALGWVGIVAFPQLTSIGAGGIALILAGGVLYTAGSIVYARKRPDPAPAVFGYHEVFHALVIVAVACQYSAIAFFVLPEH
jgi:hemolysin III